MPSRQPRPNLDSLKHLKMVKVLRQFQMFFKMALFKDLTSTGL